MPQVMGIVEGNYYMLDLFYSKPHTVLELGLYFTFSGAKLRSPNLDEILLAIGKLGCPSHNLGFHLASFFFFIYIFFSFSYILSLQLQACYFTRKSCLDSLSVWLVLLF